MLMAVPQSVICMRQMLSGSERLYELRFWPGHQAAMLLSGWGCWPDAVLSLMTRMERFGSRSSEPKEFGSEKGIIMADLNVRALKHHLKHLSQEELINEIGALFEKFGPVKDYYRAKLSADAGREVLER